jgi:C-terminal processing protease CtpA/Prc
LIDAIAKELDAHYVFPDVATKMIAAIREHVARGDYDSVTQGEEFADVLTRDLRAVSHDLHLGVRFGGRRVFGHEPTVEDMLAMGQASGDRNMHFGLEPVEHLDGNIAHLSIRGFPPLDDDQRAEVGRIMSEVADAYALIIDLRGNIGGSPKTVAFIASYLFDPTPVHINDMYLRDTGTIQESWTLANVPGKRFGSKKPIFVLTNHATFSGGEELAYDLQSLSRAKTIGETTGGGAHPVAAHVLDKQFQISVPTGRPINPITKADWEGVGVVPDVKVPSESTLEEAHRLALEAIGKSKP